MRTAFICVLGLLAGCQTTRFDAGRGPITLSTRAVYGFERYAAHESPLAFAVSEDGQVYGYSVCNNHRCRDNGQVAALDTCRTQAKGSPCRLLALGQEIVWQGSITYKADQWLGDFERRRPVAVYWDVGAKPWATDVGSTG